MAELYTAGKDERGFYVEFEEGVWERAEMWEVVDGYPIYARRTM